MRRLYRRGNVFPRPKKAKRFGSLGCFPGINLRESTAVTSPKLYTGHASLRPLLGPGKTRFSEIYGVLSPPTLCRMTDSGFLSIIKAPYYRGLAEPYHTCIWRTGRAAYMAFISLALGEAFQRVHIFCLLSVFGHFSLYKSLD